MEKEDWQQRGAGHRQRLRDRFLRQGLSSFTDCEILELLLSLGTPRQDCKVRAREALDRFGSLARVLEAPIDDLVKIPGIGAKNAFAVRFIHEVARKFLRERMSGKTYIHGSTDLVNYLWHSLSFEKREVFVAAFLDAQHAVISVEELFTGTLTASAVYPRELMKRAIALHAGAIVIAHNHPSGATKPSPQDMALTKRLHLAGRLLDIEILDHIVIGDLGSFFSFADQGLMATIKAQNEEALRWG